MPVLPGADETRTVPSGYWKIVADREGGNDIRVAAFIMEQDVDRVSAIENFQVSIEEIEKRSGLTFFPELAPLTADGFKSLINGAWFIQ